MEPYCTLCNGWFWADGKCQPVFNYEHNEYDGGDCCGVYNKSFGGRCCNIGDSLHPHEYCVPCTKYCKDPDEKNILNK